MLYQTLIRRCCITWFEKNPFSLVLIKAMNIQFIDIERLFKVPYRDTEIHKTIGHYENVCNCN